MNAFLTSTIVALLLCWGNSILSAQNDHREIVVINNYQHQDYDYRPNNYNNSHQYNKPSYAKLGVYLEKDETGVFIERVTKNSAAQAAGLQAGDRLIAFDEVKVWGSEQLIAMIKHQKGGETVRLSYQRDGLMGQVMVTLDKKINKNYRAYASFENPCEAVEKIYGRPFLGVYLDRSRGEDQEGARITSIIKNTGAAASKLQAEDRIIGLDGAAIRNSKEVHNHIQDKKKPTEPMQVEVLRDGQRLTLTAIVGSWGDRKDMQERLTQKEAACETYSNPASACAALQELEERPFLGVYMTNVSQNDGGGALIKSVIQGTQAAQTSLQGGDKIVRFNEVTISSHQEATAMILKTKPTAPVRLEVLRGDKILTIEGIMGAMSSKPANQQKVIALEEACALNQDADEPVVVAPKKETSAPLTTIEAEGNLLTLFPNPSSAYVNLVYEGQEGPLVVSITTLDGKNVYDTKVPSFKGVYQDQVDLTTFPAGIYVVYITQGAVRTSKQLVIE